MKRFFALILCTALLAGCAGTSLPTDSAAENVQQIQYDWMAGESPVRVDRTGNYTSCIEQTQNSFECTSEGCYWMCDGILLYCDHGSEEVIRLCGRPDCTHSDMTCNAHFYNGTNVNYYDGSLYVTRETQLIRLNPDGTGRVNVIDPKDIMAQGSKGFTAPHVWNEIYLAGISYVADGGELKTDYYYSKLGDEMTDFIKTDAIRGMQTDGNQYIVMDREDSSILLWDTDTNETTYLTQSNDRRGYYGAEECWYIDNGVIYRLVYETGEAEAMLDIGEQGGHALLCFSDCMIVINYPTAEQWANYEGITEQVLRFYNWDMEPVCSVKLDYPNAVASYNPVCGESPERIYLTDTIDTVPRYYINKAELGTENIAIHKLNLPDDIEQMLDEDGGVEAPIGG